MLPSRHAEISTPRLALIAIEPAMMQSEKLDDEQLGGLIDCAVPSNWPPVDWEPHVFDVLLAQYERHPEQVALNRYVALREPDGSRTLIGTVGAFWRETAPAECEVGYSILPPYEGRGLATEAVRGLLGEIRRDQRIRSVIAHTFPRIGASIRVMEKCGFV